ncbi:MAG: hypothetical protein H6R02_1475 [Burkholderiaceae bacterium]|jgi:hypothetical protein|nr:hypothetical protein [Burkholderiaceae bacterium]
MNCEPRFVKTVNLDNEQLLMIESPRGNCVCVIYRGACLSGSSLVRCRVRSGGSGSQSWRSWIRGRLAPHRMPTGRARWKGLQPKRWAPT